MNSAVRLRVVLGIARKDLGRSPQAQRELENGVIASVVVQAPTVLVGPVVHANLRGRGEHRIQHVPEESIVDAGSVRKLI